MTIDRILLLIYEDTNLEVHLQSLSRREREICGLSEEKFKTLNVFLQNERCDLSFSSTEMEEHVIYRFITEEEKNEISRHLIPLII